MMLNYAVARDYFAKNGKTVTDLNLNNPLATLTPSTVGAPQLGSIRTVTSAMHGFQPAYVAPTLTAKSDVNFSHDDRTILRVYIAVNYPLVEERDAASIIEQIISGRRAATANPWGYAPSQIARFKQKLDMLNFSASLCLRAPKTVGTRQTVIK